MNWEVNGTCLRKLAGGDTHRALEIPGPASLLLSVPSLGGGALPLSPLSEGKLLEAGPRAAGRGGNGCSRFSVLRSFPRERLRERAPDPAELNGKIHFISSLEN